MQKFRTIVETITKKIPWSRKENVSDLYSPGCKCLTKRHTAVAVPKGTKFGISVPNEAADAFENYEVELIESTIMFLADDTTCKVIRKVDDDPL